MLDIFYLAPVVVLVHMTAWFVIALIKKRNDIADLAWGLGFILLAWVAYFLQFEPTTRMALVAILVTIWGFRLAFHIRSRNHGKGEDFRYKKWREDWGRWFVPRTYLQVFLLQGVLMLIVAAPILFIGAFDIGSPVYCLDYLGVNLWIIGFIFEALGDYELSQFIKKPQNKGRIMRYKLWKFTRHPNYFGEVLQWWGIFVIALSVPFGIYSIIGPLAITFLILFVSGIPMLEKKYEGNPEFEEYKRTTSSFFPWKPRKWRLDVK
jgi:steroid 5-alpha reductase family enzyme